MTETRNICRILLSDPERQLGNLIGGMLITEWILRNRVGGCGLDSCGSEG